MFCAKCGKSVDENVKFCPGCGTSIEASASTTPIGENNGGKSLLKLGKVAGVVFCLIAGVAIAYFRDAKAYAINSSENLSVIAKLITESISANDELKPIAKVSKCTSVSLDMNAPMDSLEDGKVRKVYKGLANVEMFPRKSSWKSNDNIEYADSVITVRYDIMVVDAGKEIALKSAEMRNSDWQDLVLSTGKSGESDDNDNEDKDEDETSANSDEPPESGKLSAQVGRSQEGGSQTSIDAFMGRMEKLMEVRNKMTKEAVGWATNPSTDEERKEARAALSKMNVSERTAMLEQLESQNARLKEFLELGKVADDKRKRQGQEPFLDEDTVKTFLFRLEPEQQNELLEKMKANSNSEKRSLDSSSQSEMTGADIIREFERKPKGYSGAQIEDLQKKLAGRVLTFENGEVSRVARNMDGRLEIVAHFGKINRNLRRFSINAYFPRSEAARLIKVLDEGAHIKSLKGRVDGSEECLDSVHITEMLTLTDARIIISEQ